MKPEEVEATNSFFCWWYVAIMRGMFFSTVVVITLEVTNAFILLIKIIDCF
uniref:Uncharacterized protein n=1 Tax=Rhizophora mucronata TaxID=61149 RepID=A0A2P2MM92_RHIMU